MTSSRARSLETAPSGGSETQPTASQGGDSAAGGALAIRLVGPGGASVGLACRGELVIGRDPSTDVALEGAEVSRRHACLRIEGGALVVRDLGSRNGVFVDGLRVGDAVLVHGSVLRVGDWVGVVRRAALPEPAPAVREVVPGLYGGTGLAEALAPIARAAVSALPIVVQAPTGSGKEGVARAVHAASGRPGALVPVNCAALPEALAEAVLFGHRKGAFTGADAPATGLFRAADRGTLFLDEVHELPLAVQAKLLRAIELGEVTPVGEARAVPVDVRVVATSQEPLEEAVREGRFRADLHARLDGLTVALPALVERREDVPELFLHLLAREARGAPPRCEARLLERLCLHDWPLGVRELVQLARRLTVLHGDVPTLRASHLPARFSSGAVVASAPTQAPSPATPESLAARLPEALRASGGRVAGAARLLGISRQRVYRLLDAERDGKPS